MQTSSKNILIGVVFALLAIAGNSQSRDRHDRHVKIINETQLDVTHIYASTINTTTWEEDMLGDDVLSAGDSVTADIDDGSGYCLYDIKFVFEDGQTIVRPRINVCEIGTYRLSE